MILLSRRAFQKKKIKIDAMESYEEQNRKVRELIPADRLLEHSVKQGWKPLCDFLEISECPTSLFPKTNSARSVQVQSFSSTVVPLVAILVVLFYGFARAFQRITGRTVKQWIQLQTTLLPLVLRKSLWRKSLWRKSLIGSTESNVVDIKGYLKKMMHPSTIQIRHLCWQCRLFCFFL